MDSTRPKLVAMLMLGVGIGLLIARLDPGEKTAHAHEGHEHTQPVDEQLEKGLAKVLTVEHGDEFTVLWRPPVPVKFSVRLNRYDTPFRDKPGGKEAVDALADRIYGKYVRLAFENDHHPFQDRSQRMIAYVFDDDELVNVELIRDGAAPFFTRYGEGKFAEQFKAAEAEAKKAGRGVWAATEDADQ